jgi:hypothetical protein
MEGNRKVSSAPLFTEKLIYLTFLGFLQALVSSKNTFGLVYICTSAVCRIFLNSWVADPVVGIVAAHLRGTRVPVTETNFCVKITWGHIRERMV